MPDPTRSKRSSDSPALTVARFLASAQRRRRLRVVLEALAAGAAAFAAVMVASRVVPWPLRASTLAAMVPGVLVTATLVIVAWRRITPASTAALVERETRSFDNLLIVAHEMAMGGRRVQAHLAAEIDRQAAVRADAVRLAEVVPIRRSAILAIVICAGAAIAATMPARSTAARHEAVESRPEAPAEGTIQSLSAHVTPPSYTHLDEETLQDPKEVRLLEGSDVELQVIAPGVDAVDLVEPDGQTTRLERTGDRHVTSFVARETRFLVLRPEGTAASRARLVSIIVEPDRRPTVTIREPARDLAFPTAAGRIALQIDAGDDVALESLELRYTRVTGSGETFTFEEGTLPLALEKPAATRWTAAGELSMAQIGMEIGDTLVYRALARDGKPGADPVASESFIVEIGERGGVASAGFALPPEKDRQAISQQMVIVKTERLESSRSRLSGDELAEQARMLAVEQRMVRAEFVFMTGGEVEDEVAEAEHAHDLAEGRFENQAQVELLSAIREMSRAEAALNAADTRQALVFERAALAALQRAFDRRRYFLRTMPERARIDLGRRLTGELEDARSWTRTAGRLDVPPELARMSDVVRGLAEALVDPGLADLASLAARLGSVAPADEDLQRAAMALGNSRDEAARTAAMREGMRLLAARAQQLLAAASSATLPSEPVEGHFADEQVRLGGSTNGARQ